MKRMRAGLALHDDRAGANAIAEEADAFHQRAVGDAGRGEDERLAGRQVLRRVDPLQVGDPHRPAALFVLGRRRRPAARRSRRCRQRIAAAVSTPSGAPPMPITACTPIPPTAAAMPADRSPSGISRMRAPAVADVAR